MSERVRKVLEEAKRLTAEEREVVLRELAAELPDPEVEQAWAEEIARRIDRALDGEPAVGDWVTVCGEIAAELRRS